MENFIEFVHFLNSDKSFEFIQTQDPPSPLSDIEYKNFPFSKELLVRYKKFTYNEFQLYIEKQTNVIINEITDVVQCQIKQSLIELKNKMIFLKKNIRLYLRTKTHNGIVIHFQDMQINHSGQIIAGIYSSLPFEGKIQISMFLELEFNLLHKILSTYAQLENSNLIRISNNETVTGFTFQRSNHVDLRSIFVILDGYLTSSSFEVFEKAFSSVPIESPLRIKLLLKNRDDHSNKRALIYFLSSPIFIEMTDQELARKIHFCFADKEGHLFPLRPIAVNISQYTNALDKIDAGKTYSDWKNEIDKRIDLIQAILQNDRK
jgi:hypothetical protein